MLACCVLLLQSIGLGQTPGASEWQALDQQATDLYVQGDLPKAIVAAEQALRAASSPRESGRSLDRLGFLHYTSGRLAEGEKYLRESLRVRQEAFGIDSLEYAETANDLAMLLRDLRKMDEARSLADRAVSTRVQRLGANDDLLAESFNTLGTVFAFTGDYATAVANFEKALAIHESRSTAARASEEYGTLCVNLAGTYQRLGKYALAESAFAKGLDALRVKPGEMHPAYAASLLAYAALKVDVGHYVDAERLYEEGGRLVKAELGEDHPVYATFLNNRGFLFQSIGNAAAAAADYQRSLDLKRKLYGPGSPLAVSTLRNLAHLTYAQNHEMGERLLAEAVSLYAKASSAPPFDYTSVLLGLERAQRDRGALTDAMATAQQALAVAGKGLGMRHPLYAAAVRDLGTIEAALGQADAERLLREAIAIAEDVHGVSHPDLPPFLNALADFDVGRANYAAALPLYRRSFDIQDRFFGDVLEIGSESFKAASKSTASDPVPTLIAFQSKAVDLPAARALAFEAVTRRKGRVLEQVRSWRQRLRESTSADVRRRLGEWQALLECRTSLTVALGYRDIKPSVVGTCTLEGTDLEGRYERLLSDLRTRWTGDIGAQAVRAIADLRERGDALETALNRNTGHTAESTAPASIDDIRRQLGDDERLVEFVSYESARPNGVAERRYGAFVLDARGALEWRDIGAAAAIDAAVRDLMTAANDWSVSIRNREVRAAQSSAVTAHDALSVLSARVWGPLAPLVARASNVHRLRIAPDALLNLVPFEALTDGGHDLIERFAIAYLPAGRDVLTDPETDTASSAPVVVVSPGASTRAASVVNEPKVAFRAGGLARLPEATLEAADFRKIVPHASLYATDDATERRVKALHGPSLLHIVGHGVIRGDEDCANRTCVSNALEPSAGAMTLSAIVLEEAYGRGRQSTDDGLLTPLELENVDLHGTEMLVLSQCQMANGVASIGEGVYGMRRAAAVAGARSFVAPLWNVDDRVQRTLMERFYTELAAGKTRAEALREAKLALRRVPATASFLQWAPVILSGSASALPPALFRR
ncbi:MAG TPA: CHAT domain-containing tetratricopeptide repeat protein [Vicinamibacterales bacterium]